MKIGKELVMWIFDQRWPIAPSTARIVAVAVVLFVWAGLVFSYKVDDVGPSQFLVRDGSTWGTDDGPRARLMQTVLRKRIQDES